LLAAAIGCNLAWGIIDGFLFVLGRVFERRRVATLMQSLRGAHDAESGLAAVNAELAGDLADLGDPEDRLRFHKSIVSEVRQRSPDGVRVTSGDLRGAALVCILVLATAIPAAVPFLLIDDQYLALRVSNAVLVGLLFLVGFHWGRHVGARPWIAGTLIMSVGLVLVLVAIPLGG
jgi:VIT1/CCC1 family predicted Fe2+/Mn2+ transporter